MKTKVFDFLPEDAVFVRTEVFMNEQKFENEFDDLDAESNHLVVYDELRPVGNCRFYRTSGDCYVLGRIAVIKEYRGFGVGRFMVQTAEKYIAEKGGKEISLSAQTRVQGFYQEMGYVAEGEPYMDEHCPHVMMKKKL